MDGLLKNPRNGSYPTIKPLAWIVKNDPRIELPERQPDWSSVHPGQMLAVYGIAIIFAILIIGSVLSGKKPRILRDFYFII